MTVGPAVRNMRRGYSLTCTTCAWEKAHNGFRRDLMRSSYFDANSIESVYDVMWKHKCPLVYRTVLKHCQNHLKPLFEKHLSRRDTLDKVLDRQAEEKAAIVGELVKQGSYAETVAIKIVKKFERLVDDDQVKLSAKDGLSAIKLMMDYEKSNKDRGADIFKTLFKSADGTGQPTGA